MLAGEYITNISLREMLYNNRKGSIAALLPLEYKKNVQEIEQETNRLINIIGTKI